MKSIFLYFLFFVDIYFFEWVQKCPQTTKIFIVPRALFVSIHRSFSLYRLLFKSDGGEENLFIGCACFSHSLVRAKRKYCKRVEWQWHFLYFVCMQNICTLDLRNSNTNICDIISFFYDIRDNSLPVTANSVSVNFLYDIHKI